MPNEENRHPNTGRYRVRRESTAQIEHNLRMIERRQRLATINYGIIDLTGDDGPQLPPPPPRRRRRQSQKDIKRLGILQPSKKR